MNLKPLSSGSSNLIVTNFFSKDENAGLYFLLDWTRSIGIYNFGNNPLFNSTGINNQTEKRVQYLDQIDTIDFENFKPKDNLKYSVYVKTEDGISKCFMETEHLTYKNIRIAANQLVDKGHKVIISELYAKSKILIHQSDHELNPFSIEKSERTVFYYHSSSRTFSNLILEEDSNFDRETMESWFSMGYATMFKCKRVTYFLLGNVIKHVKNYPTNTKYIVFSKEELIEYFKNIEDALAYCNKEKSGSEFLIAEQISSFQWH